jgi:hypothetical protein
LAGIGAPHVANSRRPGRLGRVMVGAAAMGKALRVRRDGPMDWQTALCFAVPILFAYSAWLTSVVFCASNGPRPLLIADAAFFPIGVVHGIGLWLGGW